MRGENFELIGRGESTRMKQSIFLIHNYDSVIRSVEYSAVIVLMYL